MRGVICEQNSFGPDLDWTNLKQSCAAWRCYPQFDRGGIVNSLDGAEVAIVNKLVFDHKLFAQLPQLKLLCVSATGFDNIDIDAARAHQVAVCNVAGYSRTSVVQHVFTMILALSSQLLAYQQAIANGCWQRSESFCLLDFPIRELAGKTIGIIGYGNIGQAVADIARAFGMQVLLAQRGNTSKAGREPLGSLLPKVDVLSIHCPLNKQTRDLIKLEQLQLMKPTALLINTARAGIVNELDLAKALQENIIAGAGIDVLSVEPPPAAHPLLAKDIPNLLLTPHIAWGSAEARQRLLDELALNIQAFAQGQRRNRID